MTTFSIAAPDGNTYKIDGPEGATTEQVRAEVLRQHPTAGDAPRSAATATPSSNAPSPQEKPPEEGLVTRLLGSAEPGLRVASQALSLPVAAGASLYELAASPPGLRAKNAAEASQNVQQAMTYQPRTQQGQLGAKVTDAVLGAPGMAADKLTSGMAENPTLKSLLGPTGSEYLQAGANIGIQAIPAVLGARVARGGGIAADTSAAAARAEAYVAKNAPSLDWSKLPENFKNTLTKIAHDSSALDRLDPKAVERQGRLASLNVPATRGQITRDAAQLRNEGNISATEAGKPIRKVYVDQNKALLDNLDTLKGKTRGNSDSPEQVGVSVQDTALRAKLEKKQAQVKALYDKADNAGETQQHVSIQPIRDMIARSPDKTHYHWAESWFDQTAQDGKTMSVRDLEDLRKTAVRKGSSSGEERFYAGKLRDAIDQATQGAGGDLYRAARKARTEQAAEFQNQGAVARLVPDSGFRTDRTVALEDTWKKTVLSGSIQDIRNVKRSLMTGGDSFTREAGKQAWRDVRAQTIDYIKEQATKSVARFEDGTPNLTPAAMERAIRSIGQDKLNEIFDKATVKKLNEIMETTRDVKTTPPEGFKGSSTVANMLALLERGIGIIPGGHLVGGTVRAIGKISELGKTGREVRSATEDPLKAAASNSNTLGALKTGAVPLAIGSQQQPQTLSDLGPQQ